MVENRPLWATVSFLLSAQFLLPRAMYMHCTLAALFQVEEFPYPILHDPAVCPSYPAGIGVGIGSAVPPALLSEIAFTETRGLITVLHQVLHPSSSWNPLLSLSPPPRLVQLVLTFSIFFSSLLGFGLVSYVDHGWQYVQVMAL